MLELNFETFMVEAKRLQHDNTGNRRILHYLEEPNKFTLYIKSVEYWEYYTTISKQDIIAFGNEYDVDEEQAIKDFKTNFLHKAIPLKIKEVPIENFDEDLQGPLTKDAIINAGEEMVEEADDYDVFLEKKFRKWEKAIINAVDEKLKDDVITKEYVTKTFPEFIRVLFNKINTLDFRGALVKVITRNMKNGIEDAEEELKIDIGFGANFEQDVNNAVNRQLDGFTIGGKMWPGLKGVATDLQESISKIVAEGVSDRKGITTIKNEIRSKFKEYTGDEVTEGRAMKIARTESNRIHNFGKLKAFKESGLDGFKVWQTHLDERTSKVCRELHGQKVRVHDTFKSSEGEFFQPPAHPNCFPKGQKVLTNKGYKTIERINTKDKVISHKNRDRKVITTFKNKYSGFLYTFKTNKGKFKCTANHPILTNYGWKEAQDITEKDYILCIKK